MMISAVVLALLISGCTGINQPEPSQTPEATQSPEPAQTSQPADETSEPSPEPTGPEITDGQQSDEKEKASAELRALLPERKDYEWVYNGFAEYGHELELEEIMEEKDRVIYKTEGEVFDLSAGESDRDFSLYVEYIVTSDALIQNKKGEMMMDLFDNVVLIRLPLEEGRSWTQTVKGKSGEEIELKCTIEKVEDRNGARAYTVLYQDQDSPYYERRVIMEGIGVTEYTRLYMAEREGEEDFEISYWLYEEASGYDN